jgi:hypothetical protein
MVQALLATAQTPSMLCELMARRTHFLTTKKTSSNINDENGVGERADAASKLSCEVKVENCLSLSKENGMLSFDWKLCKEINSYYIFLNDKKVLF